jgi:glycosyltransferase involved in cell wall biosynthesis
MDVLHVMPYLGLSDGGLVQAASTMIEGQARAGLEVHLVAPTTLGASENEPVFTGVTKVRYELGKLDRLWRGYSKELPTLLASLVRRVEIIHIHGFWHYSLWAAAREAEQARKPFVISPQGSLEAPALARHSLRKRLYSTFFQRRHLSRAAGWHAVTESEESGVHALGITAPVELIPNAVDTGTIPDGSYSSQIDSLYPELVGKRIVLFLGRIHPIKGIDLLVQAFGKIAKECPDARLVIAGPIEDSAYWGKVNSLVDTLGVRGRIVATGMVTGDRKWALLRESTVVVQPSHSEIRSLSALEALACGVPVVVTEGCNFPELAETGAGIVVPFDAGTLAEAVIKLLRSPSLRSQMGGNGQRLVTDRFSVDNLVQGLNRLYERALAWEPATG